MFEVNILIADRDRIQLAKLLVFNLLHVIIQKGQILWQFISGVLMNLFSLIVFGLWNMQNNFFFLSFICFILLLTSFVRKNAMIKIEFSLSFQ